MDALQAFTHLTDNIPQWLTKLDDLVTKCEVQYQRFTRITHHGEVKLTRKKKHDSTESLRPRKELKTIKIGQMTDGDSANIPESSRPPFEQNEAGIMPNPLVIQRLHHKRRAASDLSAAPSAHCQYRTKSMVIVYYDAEIQAVFEALVKSIASARNNLRKGRTTASFKSRVASITKGPSPTLRSPEDSGDGILLGSRTLATPNLGRSQKAEECGLGELACFEDADRHLETAQNFCERAAHQFLRDGDCHDEIDGTRECFISCKDIAVKEMQRLKAETQVEASEKGLEEDAKTLIGQATPPSSKAQDEQSMQMNMAPSLKEVNFAGAGTIEIDDDSDDDSIHIDISAIRRTVRSTRA